MIGPEPACQSASATGRSQDALKPTTACSELFKILPSVPDPFWHGVPLTNVTLSGLRLPSGRVAAGAVAESTGISEEPLVVGRRKQLECVSSRGCCSSRPPLVVRRGDRRHGRSRSRAAANTDRPPDNSTRPGLQCTMRMVWFGGAHLHHDRGLRLHRSSVSRSDYRRHDEPELPFALPLAGGGRGEAGELEEDGGRVQRGTQARHCTCLQFRRRWRVLGAGGRAEERVV